MRNIYNLLLRHHGPQQWWPADTPFEVMVGAILTQNTVWGNVVKAIDNLKGEDLLTPRKIVAAADELLARALRPSGYYNVKARRLRNLCRWYLDVGGLDVVAGMATTELRQQLLAVNGVGHETADDILLYAFERPSFVIDSYTRRIGSRVGSIAGDEPYDDLRLAFEACFKDDQNPVALFQEYHALIVVHAKAFCRNKAQCDGCPLGICCNSSVSSEQVY